MVVSLLRVRSMTKREKELYEYVQRDSNYIPLIKHIVNLEKALNELDKLPKIKIHPKDPTKQKALPAAKQYKEFLQQYINALKVLQRRAEGDDQEEESPLRKWLNEHMDS